LRDLILSPRAIADIERLVAFMKTVAPQVQTRLYSALIRKLTALPETCEFGLQVAPDLRESYLKFGRSRYVFRYHVSENEVLVLRIWNGREDRS
jgi:plasmid stabilization system protein ParE